MLNDFDDEHSVSEAADISQVSSSYQYHNRNISGVPFIEVNYLKPSSKLMAEMAAPTIKSTFNVAKTTSDVQVLQQIQEADANGILVSALYGSDGKHSDHGGMLAISTHNDDMALAGEHLKTLLHSPIQSNSLYNSVRNASAIDQAFVRELGNDGDNLTNNSDQLIALVKGSSARNLRSFLDEELKGIKLTEVIDERGYTLLHIAAFKKFSSSFESILCTAIRKQDNASQSELLVYINKCTNDDDGYSALHLAAHRGNFIGIKYLIEEGADTQVRSTQSLSILHMSSQGESPYAYLLRELYQRPAGLSKDNDALDINVRDRNESTPLHWAVYVCSPICVSFLLAQPNIMIDAQDMWGQTPLHIAVKRSDLRIIRQLLVKGADTEVKSKEGNTPLDLASLSFDENDSFDIETKQQIQKAFQPDGITAEMVMLRTPNKPL